tara:strand:- start:1861 stop:2037 length:177 start_codon:yes stop_codon:yes gene_type:complete
MIENLSSEAALIEKAKNLIPVLKERAERDRCMPKDTDQEFREAGLSCLTALPLWGFGA